LLSPASRLLQFHVMGESVVRRKARGSCRGTTVAMLVRRKVRIRAPQSPASRLLRFYVMRESVVRRNFCGSCRGTTVAMLVRHQVRIRAPQSPASRLPQFYVMRESMVRRNFCGSCRGTTVAIFGQAPGLYQGTAIASKPAPTVLCHARKRGPQSPASYFPQSASCMFTYLTRDSARFSYKSCNPIRSGHHRRHIRQRRPQRPQQEQHQRRMHQ